MNIVKSGGKYFLFSKAEVNQAFPPGNYSLNFDCKGNLFLEDESSFQIPEKFYDVDKDMIFHILEAYKSGKRNIGVLLQGAKGQGKSLTAKVLCMNLALPVIMINRKIPLSVDFVSYLSSIDQDIAVLVDEFEKLFPLRPTDAEKEFHSQSSFLGLMDGAISGRGRKVFILTANDDVEDKLVNRPSRVRYFRKYSFMDADCYNQIIEEELENKEHEKDLRENLPVHSCNMDLLREIISEINLHNEKYSTFKNFFNFKEKLTDYIRYKKKGNEWVLFDSVSISGEINPSTDMIAGKYGCRITGIFPNGDITYSTKEWAEKDEDLDIDDPDYVEENGTVQVEYKLVRKEFMSTIVEPAIKTRETQKT